MHELGNPYEPPSTAIDFNVVPSQKIALSYGKVLIAVFVRVVFRFLGALIIYFLILIDFKGLRVNWPNAVPIIALFCVGCVVSHFVLDLRSTSDRLAKVTGWPLYLAGILFAIMIVVTKIHPSGF